MLRQPDRRVLVGLARRVVELDAQAADLERVLVVEERGGVDRGAVVLVEARFVRLHGGHLTLELGRVAAREEAAQPVGEDDVAHRGVAHLAQELAVARRVGGERGVDDADRLTGVAADRLVLSRPARHAFLPRGGEARPR